MPVLAYGSETMIWREKERSARIRQLCGVTKGVDEKIDDWFGHVERMKNDMIAKRVYVG